MPWYGWIPILTDEVLPRKASGDLAIYTKSTSRENIRILETISSSKLYPTIRTEGFSNSEEFVDIMQTNLIMGTKEEILYYLKIFDDWDQKNSKVVGILLDNSALIKKVAIFSHSTKLIEATASVKINSQGLVEFEFEQSSPDMEIYSKPIFITIRDFYHQHVYTSATDTPLKPVYAQNQTEAINLIFYQYKEKIIDYHRIIKNMSVYRGGVFGLPRKKMALVDDISSACGEMIYATSFIKLFNFPLRCLESVEQAYNSFEVLKYRTNATLVISGNRFNAILVILTILISFFGTYYMLSQSSKLVAGALAILTSIMIIVCLIFSKFVAASTKTC